MVIFNQSHLIWYSSLWTVPKHSCADENRWFGGLICHLSSGHQCPPVSVEQVLCKHDVSAGRLEALRVLGLIRDRDLWAVDPRNKSPRTSVIRKPVALLYKHRLSSGSQEHSLSWGGSEVMSLTIKRLEVTHQETRLWVIGTNPWTLTLALWWLQKFLYLFHSSKRNILSFDLSLNPIVE